MNATKMPGFNAETSLYKTNGHYRLAVGGAGWADVQVGLPQLIRPVPDGDGPDGDGDFRDCMSECVQACDYEFPPGQGRMRAQCVRACLFECGP